MQQKYLIIITAVIASCTLGIFAGEATKAQDSIAVPPLGFSSEASVTSDRIDEESYEKIKSLANRNHSTAEIALTNIKPRENISSLELITGKTAAPNQELWTFLLTDEKKVYSLGETKSRANKEFSFIPGPLPTLKGQAFLVSSLVSDLRLAGALPEKTSITPLYFSGSDEDITTSIDETKTILIDRVAFFENGSELKTLRTTSWEVYKSQTETPLTITISGQLYAPPGHKLQLSTVILPGLEQQSHSFLNEDEGTFTLQLETNHLSWEEPVQVLVLASENSKTILETTELSTHQVISFTLKPLQSFPTSWTLALQALKKNSIGAGMLLLVISILLIWGTYKHQSRWAKTLSIGVVLVEIGLISTLIILSAATIWFEKGILEIPGEEKIIVSNGTIEKELPSLTRLDENLEITPGLSTSWSNISPHIWEFVLRNGVSIESISLGLQNKIQTGSLDRHYLTSIKNIISVNPNKLQILTQYPDPLLPQKLSKVSFEKWVNEESTTELYKPLEEYTNSSRYEKNESYYNLPFLKNPAKYQTILRAENQESLKALIRNGTGDIFDEPETKLWPTLLQNGYRILPKINTESLVIMTDRNSFFLKNPEVIRALQIILKSPRILQTSYFQYGQMASQFAPPGVVGYDAELRLEQSSEDPKALLDSFEQKNQSGEIILTFQYPHQERVIANIIRQELERVGIKVISTEIENQDYEKALLQRTTDLRLIPLDFDIGDIGPFLDALIDSKSPFNKTYFNARVDELVYESRTELNRVKRLKLLQEIMAIIVHEDPAGIPLLFKRSFLAEKEEQKTTWWEKWLQEKVLGWR